MQCVHGRGVVQGAPFGVRSMKGMFTAEGAWPEANSSGVLQPAETEHRQGRREGDQEVGAGGGGRRRVDGVGRGVGRGVEWGSKQEER